MIFDICIVGAGAVGGMLARELSKYRLNVVLLEKSNDVADGATKANSAIIHGGFDPVPGTLKARLNVRGIPLLKKAAAELNVPVIENGSMVIAFGKDEEEELRFLNRRGAENGAPETTLLTGDQARKLEPQISPRVTGALLSKEAGIICPYKLAIAAVGNAIDNGVCFKRNFELSSVGREDGIFTLSDKKGQSVKCKYVINCAGTYSDHVAELFGDRFFDIIPRAGEYLLLDKSEGGRVKHTIFKLPDENGKGILVTPTVDGNLLTGPTASQVKNRTDTGTTFEGLDKIRNSALHSVPGVDFSKTVTSFSGVRASTSGGDFIIKPSEKVQNLIHCAGIDSPGLTSCCAIAEYTVNIIRDMGLCPVEKDNWTATRPDTSAFRKMSPREKDQYIKLHPSYGHIICRCEGISEGEIIDALTRTPQALDLDGVKRRTRAGMGRCQGGFCTPHVMEIIADTLGISMEEITKQGVGSEILTGRLNEG